MVVMPTLGISGTYVHQGARWQQVSAVMTSHCMTMARLRYIRRFSTTLASITTMDGLCTASGDRRDQWEEG